jgi:hypothetical protein
MVKELHARGVTGQALLSEVMRLTGMPAQFAHVLVSVELTGRGDTYPPPGAAPDLSRFWPSRGDESPA